MLTDDRLLDAANKAHDAAGRLQAAHRQIPNCDYEVDSFEAIGDRLTVSSACKVVLALADLNESDRERLRLWSDLPIDDRLPPLTDNDAHVLVLERVREVMERLGAGRFGRGWESFNLPEGMARLETVAAAIRETEDDPWHLEDEDDEASRQNLILKSRRLAWWIAHGVKGRGWPADIRRLEEWAEKTGSIGYRGLALAVAELSEIRKYLAGEATPKGPGRPRENVERDELILSVWNAGDEKATHSSVANTVNKKFDKTTRDVVKNVLKRFALSGVWVRETPKERRRRPSSTN